jgi:hypothetical protein
MALSIRMVKQRMHKAKTRTRCPRSKALNQLAEYAAIVYESWWDPLLQKRHGMLVPFVQCFPYIVPPRVVMKIFIMLEYRYPIPVSYVKLTFLTICLCVFASVAPNLSGYRSTIGSYIVLEMFQTDVAYPVGIAHLKCYGRGAVS